MRKWAHPVLGLALLSACALAQPSEILVITNVNVVDTRFGTIHSGHTVVIKDGRIAAVAHHALIDDTRHVRIVNANGKYLIPGLWDMHVHTAGGPAAPWDEHIIYPLYVANGVTGIRDMGGDLELLQRRRSEISGGDITGPHIIMAGPFLNGGKSDAQTIGVNTPEEGRAAVRELNQRGVDFIKVLSGLSREGYFAVADEARKFHLPLAGHLPESVSATEASEAGQRSIEHLAGMMLACSSREIELRERRMVDLSKDNSADYETAGLETIATYDRDRAWALFVTLADNYTWQVPTLSWWRAMADLHEERAASDSRLQYVPASAREQWLPDSAHDHAPESANLKKVAARYLELAGAMRRAGVPFLAGTDSPDSYVFPGFSLHDELELMVQAGFTNLEALQTATFNPALFQAKLDQYGVVEPGRVADLVLLDGNPLSDIRNTRRISAVVLGGRLFERPQLDEMLSHVEQRARAEKTTQRAAEHAAAISAQSN